MIRFTKSGTWAVGGVDPRAFEQGQRIDLGPKENADLVAAGWAEHVSAAKEPPEKRSGNAPRPPGQKPSSGKS